MHAINFEEIFKEKELTIFFYAKTQIICNDRLSEH